jgi:hypothetical protein
MPIIWKSKNEGYFVDKDTKEKWEEERVKTIKPPVVSTEGNSDTMPVPVLNGIVENEK